MTPGLILVKALRFIICVTVAAAFAGLCALSFKERWLGARILGVAYFAVAILSATGAVRTFIPERRHPSLGELEAQGRITTEEHEGTRAIAIEEFEDEGSCYLIELRDGSTLCLRGQYLYDYEGGEDADGSPQPRRFPNTRFQVKGDRDTGMIWDLICLGEAFEPVLTIPAEWDPALGEDIPDGEIVTAYTFDQLIESKGRLPKSATEV
ncbi:hypothetical protein [Luteolibacter sp. LG18]|uniref:hypothetical protein n=1 Tax=Luteolibacter sp. LG18 TaxID=2819286 RepID=UPI002B30D724|nr:hypothetical protein llg_35450 [Luteolibacter sp. LG18]